MSDRFSSSIVFPNFTPPRWFECDVFELTKAGYFREYEIKVSRSDFFADRRKGVKTAVYESGKISGMKYRTKYDMLANRTQSCPNQFFYCVPKGLIGIEDVPEWAGLIEFGFTQRNILIQVVVKAPPRLHTDKKTQYKNLVHEASYWRFHRQINVQIRNEQSFMHGDGI